MEDLRLWSRKMILELLEKYKSLPALWHTKSPEYKNKSMKTKAYRELVDFCKKNGFPEANRDFVVKKIQSLRGSFRKELNKSKQHKLQGKKYHSNLWYYKHLLFTKGQESDEDDSQSEESFKLTFGDDDFGDFANEEFDIHPVSPKNVSPPSSPTNVSNLNNHHEPPAALQIDQEANQDYLKIRGLTESELTGLTIARKLARMNPVQAVYAESIINNVIRRGLLEKLKEETDLCDNMCRRLAGLN